MLLLHKRNCAFNLLVIVMKAEMFKDFSADELKAVETVKITLL